MKKILVFAAAMTVLFAACKKDDEVATTNIVAPTFPTITFSAGQFYSINTGGSLPTVAATAYDSTLKEVAPVVIKGTDALDNTTPGLYIVTARATNKYGYYTEENVYIAVTNVSPSINLAGKYLRSATNGIANVTKLANGLYATDNVGGVLRTDRPDLLFPVLFVQLTDTSIDLPEQPSPVGTLAGSNEKLIRVPGDTTYQYILAKGGNAFGTTATRVFKKQ